MIVFWTWKIYIYLYYFVFNFYQINKNDKIQTRNYLIIKVLIVYQRIFST